MQHTLASLEKIFDLFNKTDTIHQFGQQLSAGEAQLICFARALASPAPVILLDEATANIDSLREHAIQQATNALLKQKTVIVIAHRLSTIQHADTIIALKNGHIIEQGNHAELMAANGFYSKLYGIQFTERNSALDKS